MKQLAKPSAFIMFAVAMISRLLPHPANVTPIGGSALFGGAKLGRPLNYVLPLLAMLLTDLVIGFHGTMIYVYLGIALIVFLGEKLLQKQTSGIRVATVSILGSCIFFLVTNFGVWAEGILYPRTAVGLLESYAMGLPFLRNSLLGDIVFSVGFFRVFAWAEKQQLTQTFDNKVTALLRTK